MNELLEQLGIDWKIFLGQIVNFFILLTVLWAFVYRPLIKIIKERNEKIKTGLQKAEEANVRLKEVDNIGKEKLKEAENQSIEIIKKTEQEAKDLEHNLQEKAEEKHKKSEEQFQEALKKQKEEAKGAVLKDAAELVKKVFIKTVGLKPDAVDEVLIKKAVEDIRHE